MIKIRYKNINRHFEFVSEGHAGYDDLGKDIVCSAVSSIIIGALNALKNIDSFDIKTHKGFVSLKSLKDYSEHDGIVLETMMVQLYTIESEYKEFLNIKQE